MVRPDRDITGTTRSNSNRIRRPRRSGGASRDMAVRVETRRETRRDGTAPRAQIRHRYGVTKTAATVKELS